MYSLILVTALAGVFIWKALRNVFLSPLRRVPGPFLARITPLWLNLVDLSGNRTSTIHKLHQKYGSSVLIGPDEISFSSREAVEQIYGQQTDFLKAPIYDALSVPPLGIFSMRGKAEHRQRRRLLSHAFSQSSLYNSEPLIQDIVQKLANIVNNNIGQPLDMLSFFRLAAFDIVGELFLGQTFGGLDSTESPQFLIDMDHHFLLCGIENSLPPIYSILGWLPSTAVKRFLGARERLIEYGKMSLDKYIACYGRDSGRKDLLTKILTDKVNKSPLTDQETYTEIANLVLGGTDTTSTTLTYLFFELAKNPQWQSRLRSELTGLASAERQLSFKELADMPILEAVVSEALRLHPAAPASLPRQTPPGGRTLDGIFVPENTVVSVQCYSTQRDPVAFPNPDVFLPDRWMGREAVSDSMKALFIPFSTGTRACLGKSLAMMELKMITASLVQGYDVSLASETTDESMAMTDHFLVLPKSGRCNLVFTKTS